MVCLITSGRKSFLCFCRLCSASVSVCPVPKSQVSKESFSWSRYGFVNRSLISCGDFDVENILNSSLPGDLQTKSPLSKVKMDIRWYASLCNSESTTETPYTLLACLKS